MSPVCCRYFDFYASYPDYFLHFLDCVYSNRPLHSSWTKNIEKIDRSVMTTFCLQRAEVGGGDLQSQKE